MEELQSSSIKVESLQKEYEVLLQQYQEAVQNYISLLQNGTENELTYLKGRTWWGTGKINETNVDTQEECASLCLNEKDCSGATFNPSRRYCWIRKGDTSITVGKDDDYAIVKKSTESINVMKSLNERLLDLNIKIVDELTKVEPIIKEQNKNKDQIYKKLDVAYQQLLKQKMEMDAQLREYYNIEESIDNTSLFVNQQNSIYLFLVLLVCLLLLIIFRIQYSFLISIILLMIFTYTLRNPTWFAIWFVLLVIVCYLHS